MRILAIVAVAISLGACSYLSAADKISETAVRAACAQPESVRVVERSKLADWGLWAQCVPQGTPYTAYRLVKGAE